MDEKRCSVTPVPGFYGHRCTLKGKVERDGKWFCGRHDPVARKERRARGKDDREKVGD